MKQSAHGGRRMKESDELHGAGVPAGTREPQHARGLIAETTGRRSKLNPAAASTAPA